MLLLYFKCSKNFFYLLEPHEGIRAVAGGLMAIAHNLRKKIAA
jgi:hypothetical protein